MSEVTSPYCLGSGSEPGPAIGLGYGTCHECHQSWPLDDERMLRPHKSPRATAAQMALFKEPA